MNKLRDKKLWLGMWQKKIPNTRTLVSRITLTSSVPASLHFQYQTSSTQRLLPVIGLA